MINKIAITCVNGRYWSNNNIDIFWIVVDIYRDDLNSPPETYYYRSLEG